MNQTFALPDTFAAANKAGVESAIAFANLMFAGMERYTPLTVNAARDTFDEVATAAKHLVAVKTPQELSELQAGLAQPAIDRSVAYAREAYDIAASNQRALIKHFDAQVADLNKNLASMLDGATKNAPAGSEMAFAAIKQVMGAANAAYESVNKATLQAADLAENNLKAAAEFGGKTVAAAKAKKGA